MIKRLPQLVAEGEILPEAWEKSLLLLNEKAVQSKKESYTNISGVDEILECSMKIVVRDPLKEPMIHRGCDGLMELRGYIDEVLKGTKDWRIGEYWDYTYHQRLFEYALPSDKKMDQIAFMIEKISKTSFSNRAQAITWMPHIDSQTGSPPCLQRVWCKIIDDEFLEMHTSWRSRDAFNAAFMNMYALVHLQKSIAEKLGVKVGQYVDDSDSYHVYDRNFKQLKKFVKTVDASKKTGRSPWAPSSILDVLKGTSLSQ